VRLLSSLRNRDVDVFVLDRHDHIAVLIVAEGPGASFLEAFERLGDRVTVGVVRTDLNNGYLGLEAAQEQWGRGGLGAIMGDLQDGKGSDVQNMPLT
jgi:hypothetical protein